MNAEDYTQNLKQNPKLTKEEIKRARRIAIVLAGSIVISILFLVYAFIKKEEADRLGQLTKGVQQELLRERSLAAKARQEAEEQRVTAAEALVALEECNKSKK